MLLKANRFYITDSKLALTAASFAAQSISISIPRVAPYALEWLFITLTVTMGTAITSGTIGWALMNLLKQVQISNVPNANGKPSNVVDISGASLLQFVSNEGLNLDAATLTALGQNNIPNLISGGIYQLTYAIPMAPPNFADGLRPRCYLPIHTYNQDPVLKMSFSAATEMSGVGNPFSAVVVEVWGVRREMPDAVITKINATGGFMSWDLLEQNFTLPNGITNSLQKFALPTPGSYSGILINQLKGGATSQTPGDMTTLGGSGISAESEWTLKGAGKDLLEQTKMKHLAILNDLSKPYNGVPVFDNAQGAYVQNATSWARFGGALSAGRAIQDPSSTYFDFASDGITDVTELGSLLDTNVYAARGLEVAFYTYMTTIATTKANVVNVAGRRFYGDLTQFQLLTH